MADFSWAALGDTSQGVVGGISKGLLSIGGAEIAKANAESANTVRAANNEVKSANLGLAATIRSLNDKRQMDAAATHLQAVTDNGLRAQDAYTRRDFEGSVRASQQWGAAAASAAASGLGGAGIRAMSQATDMQINRQQQVAAGQEQDALFDASHAGDNIISQAVAGLAQGPLSLGYDFSVNQPAKQPDIAGALIQGLAGKTDSIKTLLGSLYTNTPTTGSAPPSAVATAVAPQDSITSTALAPLSITQAGDYTAGGSPPAQTTTE